MKNIILDLDKTPSSYLDLLVHYLDQQPKSVVVGVDMDCECGQPHSMAVRRMTLKERKGRLTFRLYPHETDTAFQELAELGTDSLVVPWNRVIRCDLILDDPKEGSDA